MDMSTARSGHGGDDDDEKIEREMAEWREEENRMLQEKQRYEKMLADVLNENGSLCAKSSPIRIPDARPRTDRDIHALSKVRDNLDHYNHKHRPQPMNRMNHEPTFVVDTSGDVIKVVGTSHIAQYGLSTKTEVQTDRATDKKVIKYHFVMQSEDHR